HRRLFLPLAGDGEGGRVASSHIQCQLVSNRPGRQVCVARIRAEHARSEVDRRALPGAGTCGANTAWITARIRRSRLARAKLRTGAFPISHECRRLAMEKRVARPRRAFRKAGRETTRRPVAATSRTGCAVRGLNSAPVATGGAPSLRRSTDWRRASVLEAETQYTHSPSLARRVVRRVRKRCRIHSLRAASSRVCGAAFSLAIPSCVAHDPPEHGYVAHLLRLRYAS